MTERTIRSLAKELAGAFYEDSQRSVTFRQAFPTRKDYIRGLWHQPNGEILIKEPGWTHHIDLARKMLGTMLGRNDVSPIMKERIFDALIDENNRRSTGKTHQVSQRKIIEPLH